mmetsp:Transcript_3535/g.11852  ORF Transcript_3535/g.11852 Transcript_3535/m.11852 type:complete len:327 (-) Transcript_3535:144-1124(-)
MLCAALPLAAAIVRGPPILRYGSAAIDTRGAPSLIAPSSVASALEGTDSALDSMDLAALALDGSFRPTRGPDGRLEPVLTLPGDSLETTPPMGAVTVSSTAATLGVVALAFVRSGSPLPPLLGVAAGALLGELFSGAFHWATDNYGRLETPVVGFACAAFQGHHLAPWTISHRSVFNNVYKIAGATLPLLGLGLALLPPSGAACVAVMFYLQLIAQEFHRWSHTPPSKLPEWKRRLQRAGVALPVPEHIAHHKPPFDKHYCILTGRLNGVLDSEPVLLWRRLEALVYRVNGQEPLSWKSDKVRALALSLWPARRDAAGQGKFRDSE